MILNHCAYCIHFVIVIHCDNTSNYADGMNN